MTNDSEANNRENHLNNPPPNNSKQARERTPEALDKTYGDTKKNLEKFLKTKNPRSSYEFGEKSNKEDGINSGFISKTNNDGHSHMVKTAEPGDITMSDFNNSYDYIVACDERRDFLTELATSGVYKRVLNDRAPDMQLVTDYSESSEKGDKPKLALSSRFLGEFSTANELVEDLCNKEIPYDQIKNNPLEILNRENAMYKKGIDSLEDKEKVFAASFLLGEQDLNEGNIGITSGIDNEKQASPKDPYTAAKIDHGRSLNDHKEELKRHRASDLFSESCVNDEVELDSSKLADAFEEISNLSSEEARDLVDASTDKLKKELKKISKEQGGDPSSEPGDLVGKQLLDDMEAHKDRITTNLAVFKKMTPNVQIASQVESKINKDNLSVLDNPIEYAKANGKSINQKAPEEIAKEMNVTSEYLDVRKFAKGSIDQINSFKGKDKEKKSKLETKLDKDIEKTKSIRQKAPEQEVSKASEKDLAKDIETTSLDLSRTSSHSSHRKVSKNLAMQEGLEEEEKLKQALGFNDSNDKDISASKENSRKSSINSQSSLDYAGFKNNNQVDAKSRDSSKSSDKSVQSPSSSEKASSREQKSKVEEFSPSHERADNKISEKSFNSWGSRESSSSKSSSFSKESVDSSKSTREQSQKQTIADHSKDKQVSRSSDNSKKTGWSEAIKEKRGKENANNKGLGK